jgi:hypothetical protein
MSKKSNSILSLMAILLLSISFWGTAPAWSAPGDKEQVLKKSTDKDILDLEKPETGEKGKKSVKKKAVKKAGTAAAVGVVGKKATSGVKKNTKGTEK